MKWVCSVVLCTICLTATSKRVAAQPGPLEPSDTSSPEATLASFLSACNEFHALTEDGKTGAEPDMRMLSATERMLDCLDLTGLPEELRDSSGREAAVFLKEVLDRIDLSADPVLMNPDADSAKTELQYRIAGTRLTISRCNSGPTHGQYLFSTATVRRAARFYSAARGLSLRSTGPAVSAGLRDRYLALTKTQPRLSADTSSPRGTLTLFLNTAEEIYAITQSKEGLDRNDPMFLPVTMQLISCLDTSDLPEYSRQHFAAEAAVCLKEVLDRLPRPPPEQIPGPEDVENSEFSEPLLR